MEKLSVIRAATDYANLHLKKRYCWILFSRLTFYYNRYSIAIACVKPILIIFAYYIKYQHDSNSSDMSVNLERYHTEPQSERTHTIERTCNRQTGRSLAHSRPFLCCHSQYISCNSCSVIRAVLACNLPIQCDSNEFEDK